MALDFIGGMGLDNTRIELVTEEIVPDFSSIYPSCPSSECIDCEKAESVVMCRVCCSNLYTNPISYSDVYGYSAFSLDWLVDIAEWSGLRLIFQSLQGAERQPHSRTLTQEVYAFIQKFHWFRNIKPSPLLEVVELKVKPSEDQICGYYEVGGNPEGRIVGGKEVMKINKYPWQLSLSTGYLGMLYQHRCGAAVVSAIWAITAAHCLQAVSVASRLYVLGGFTDMEKWDWAQIRRVEKYYNHENFSASLYEQDIALLKLESPLLFTPNVLPVCLPAPSYRGKFNSAVGKTALLSGWGRHWETGPLVNQLEMVELPVIDNWECMKWYNRSGSRQYIPEKSFLCAGYEDGGFDACNGDSGGPLIIYRADGRAELLGIVSWGIGCGIAGRPGVYTRVGEFLPWIQKTMRMYDLD